MMTQSPFSKANALNAAKWVESMNNTLPCNLMAYARKSVAKAVEFLKIHWNAMMEIQLTEMDAAKIVKWKKVTSAPGEAPHLQIAA